MTLNLARTVLLWDPADPKEFDLDPSAFRAMGIRDPGNSLRPNRCRC